MLRHTLSILAASTISWSGGAHFTSGSSSFAPIPLPDPIDGFLMGRDFTALLANPFLELEVERSEGEVLFVWSAESDKLLDEVEALGEFLATAKRELEYREQHQNTKPGLRWSDETTEVRIAQAATTHKAAEGGTALEVSIVKVEAERCSAILIDGMNRDAPRPAAWAGLAWPLAGTVLAAEPAPFVRTSCR